MLSRGVLLFGSARREDEGEDWGAAEVPPEFYLREFLDLDATDPASVLAFCEKWGPIGRDDCSDLPALPFAGPFARDADDALPLPWSPRWAHMDPEKRARQLRRTGLHHLSGVHSVARAAVYQDALSNMVSLWRYLNGDLEGHELARLARPLEGMPYLSVTREALPSVEVDRVAFDLVNQLNLALAPFHVRLELQTGHRQAIGMPLANCFQAACLQLANHIAEHAVYQRCANETCGRLFVRQRGGSKLAEAHGAERGQYHGTGVLYCTPQCARAQAARALRRRKAAERGASH